MKIALWIVFALEREQGWSTGVWAAEHLYGEQLRRVLCTRNRGPGTRDWGPGLRTRTRDQSEVG